MLFLCRLVPLCIMLMLLLFCGACSQRWQFATPSQRSHLPGLAMEPNFSGGETASWQQTPTQPYVAARPCVTEDPTRQQASPVMATPQPVPPATPSVFPVSNSTTNSTVGANFPTVSQNLGSPCMENVPTENPCVEDRLPCYKDHSHFGPRSVCEGVWQDVCGDYHNYYTCCNARNYLYAIAGGSLLANTSLDDDFRDWYQRDARSEESDNFASFWKVFGEGEYVIPFFACTALAGKALDQFPVGDVVGEHGYRTTRAYLVGAPPVIFSQYLLGGSRPNEAPHESMWRPFEDNNGVSGHAFMGAVPFITAAQMSDCCLAKAGFYTLSTFPAWSRVNDDAHFLSQVCLGWYMAYMACRSVNETENPDSCFELLPCCEPGGAGIMAIWKR